MELLGALTLDEDGVGPQTGDLARREQIGAAQMVERGDEGAVGLLTLVPHAGQAGELGADEDLVDGGVETDPRIARGEGGCVAREEVREVRVLEVADPVGDAEVAEVDDGLEVEAAELGEDFVGEGPVERLSGGVDAVVGWAVAEVAQAEVAGEPEILAPAAVVVSLLELVDAAGAAVLGGDGGVGALNAGGEDEGGLLGHGAHADSRRRASKAAASVRP